MTEWKVGIAYQRYGYINVEAETKEEAIGQAEERLRGMTVAEMEEVTDYLQDSEEVDEEFVEVVE